MLHCCSTDVIRWVDPVHQFQPLSSCSVSFPARFAKTNLETKAVTVHLGSAQCSNFEEMEWLWTEWPIEDLLAVKIRKHDPMQYSELGHHKWWLKEISSGWMTAWNSNIKGCMDESYIDEWCVDSLLLHRSLHHLPQTTDLGGTLRLHDVRRGARRVPWLWNGSFFNRCKKLSDFKSDFISTQESHWHP